MPLVDINSSLIFWEMDYVISLLSGKKLRFFTIVTNDGITQGTDS